ncbi:MAG: MBL fold metallo-hydrolase [Verrucomicrobiota bacterium]|jgi:glyoxylase-like metal-dependent hydrolase (beta-lactamase superfamily II)
MSGAAPSSEGASGASQPDIRVFCEVTPAFTSCAYVVLASGTDEALVIDPGNPVADGMMKLLERLQVRRVTYVVLTHEHFDHILGAEPLRERLGSRLVCSQRCAEAIGDPKSNMSFYKDGKGMVCGPADWICERDGWELPWSADAVRLMPTPGHSPGGLCAAIGGHLFTGDTLLGNRRTPTHLPGGDAAALEQSIKLLLNEFDSKTLVYPGHGSCFALGEVELGKVVGPCHPARVHRDGS